MAASRRRSKKRSAASSRSKPPESLVYFLDRCLGRRAVAEALRSAGADVRVHDDLFEQDETDERWLSEVGRHGWVVLTKDSRIRYRSLERDALVNAGVRAFVLTARDMTGHEMGESFVRALARMSSLARNVRGAFIARISRTGAVVLIHPRD